MFRFLIKEVSAEAFFLLAKLADLKISFFAEPDQFHVEIADLVFLFLAVFFQFADFQFILFIVAEVMALKVLNFKMILIFELADLHVLHVLDICSLLLQLLNLVDQFTSL